MPLGPGVEGFHVGWEAVLTPTSVLPSSCAGGPRAAGCLGTREQLCFPSPSCSPPSCVGWLAPAVVRVSTQSKALFKLI